MSRSTKQPWSWWGMKLERRCAMADCPRQFDEAIARSLYEEGFSVIDALDRLPLKPWAARPESAWKAGSEFAPFHPSASHVRPDYRDGWNSCYAMAEARIADLERRLQEAGRAELDAEAADELERKRAGNIWDSFDDVVPTLKAARDGSWQWYRNMRCKYIVLRIDMRDLGCIIKDREGERITVSQLQHQHASAPSAAAAAGKE